MIKHQKNRNRIDIVREILGFTAGVAMSKTRIMYACNLNHQQTNWYLDILLQADLINEKDGEFKITPKGKEYLDMAVKLAKMMPL